MREIKLSSRNPNADFSYTELNKSHYDEVLSADTRVLDPDGEIVFILLKRVLSPAAVGQAWRAVEDWNPMSPLRSLAKGIKQQYRYKDGKKTNYLKGRTYCCSGVMGYFNRFPTVPCCRPCSFNALHPDKFEMLLPLTREVAALHAAHDPKSWNVYEEFNKTVHDDWKIGGTPYHTITMNKNFQTWPHKDAKNLHATCPMTIIRKGKYRGGNLVFPEHRLAVEIDTTDLIIFMNSTEWHGNTRITGLTDGYVRSSFIWYARSKMQECLSMEEERERVKNLGGFGALAKGEQDVES